jgi:phenylacetic acid degradation operon negative regulatory protein
LATQTRIIDDLLTAFARRRPTRAGSLVVTVFGDSISPHGNSVGLVSLINALEPFGLNARQLRTAVFRLVREGWLKARQKGRRSFYSLTETGVRQFTRAARRIYAAQRPQWDGNWTLVIPAQVPAGEREALRRELLWLGYGAINPGMFAHPTADRRSLNETLQERKLANQVVVLTAQTPDVVSAEGMKKLCRECWRLDQIAVCYEAFLTRFRPVLQTMRRARVPDPAQCFQLRTLLIHEYRRILLHDTDLPDDLLPADWPGREALNLTASLYRLVQHGAVGFLRRDMEAMDGPLPAPDPGYYGRFGGVGCSNPSQM